MLTDARREPDSGLLRAELTEHTVVEIVLPAPDASLSLDERTIQAWGVSPDEVVEQAGRNLASRGARSWGVSREYPGVYRPPGAMASTSRACCFRES